ncbi:ABC transporter permease [Rhodovastum atsumiense]|uniref:ABC transporter permease n=1 Tax=Rhodovastum atsumiense TaxID=504468 RepID=A0A5M6J4R2_9PROT|nr:ABC transporter permease [Rhodovastum atsumiense]KAA5614568.1 ABC transporter permease [Rhodovastum atsumiense]CAH2599939.1 ABC transporter permease [Rhodovastum atsumiense]
MSAAADAVPVAVAATGRRPPRWSGAPLRIAGGATLPLLIFLAWELASHLGWVSAVFLPTPERTALALVEMLLHQNFLDDLVISLSIVLQGFAWGGGLGLLVGLACGLSRPVERLLGPTLDSVRQIPSIAWLPLIVLWVGIGPLAKVVVISKVVFFPVFLNTLQGVRGVPKLYADLGAVLTLSRLQLVRRVILPAAMPSILVGIRYGASLAWALIVVAEGLSGMQGIGYLIFRAQALLMTDQLLVCMVVIGLVGFTIDRLLRLLERRLLRWQQGFPGQ